MLAPKGAAFLYVRRESQPFLDPLVVSCDSNPTPEFRAGSRVADLLQWTGTRDPAPYLAVLAAIQFMQEQNWEKVRLNCHRLLHQAIKRVCELTDLQPLYPLDAVLYSQMGIAPLPRCDHVLLKSVYMMNSK